MNLYTDPDILVKELNYFTDPIYEAGGFILEREGMYMFLYLRNKHHNTDTGRALYEPEDQEYADAIFPLTKNGWHLYASVHTHPSFSPVYSQIDYSQLFQGFKHNYIKSVRQDTIVKWSWKEDGTNLDGVFIL
jgi:proteasome lid subunit RPN8/RPN11